MYKDAPIGFFDSGVGGLSVYARFKNLLPNENTIYFGDLKNMPYGNKTTEELIGYARNILNFFESKQVKAVVIACNTSSAIAYEKLKNDYDFAIYPIIQMCAEEVASYGLSTVGVFATAATIKSNAYKNELQRYSSGINVIQISCPNWTNWVENGMPNSAEAQNDIKDKMDEMMSYNPEKIILGCTHYPYLIDLLKKYANEDIFIDPAVIFAKSVKENLIRLDLINNNPSFVHEEFYVSANPEAFVNNSKRFYDLHEHSVIVKNI